MDEYATLRAAHKAGCRIQAWTLNDGATGSNDGYWRTLDVRAYATPAFTCPAHLYRIHPDDLAILTTEPVAEPVAWAVELEDGSIGGFGWASMDTFATVQAVATLREGTRYVFAYRENTTPTEPAPDREDAERYRFLKSILVSADFEPDDYVGLTFALPAGSQVSANLDATLDAARQEPA